MAGFRPLEPQWHADPFRRHEYRFWDGTAWTERVADNGVEGIDPVPPTSAPQPSFRQPEPAAAVVDPTPPPRPPEPAPIPAAQPPAPPTPEPVGANASTASANPGGPFVFNDAELDHAPPEAVELDRLDGGGGPGKLVGLAALVVALVLGGFFLLRAGDDADPVAQEPGSTDSTGSTDTGDTGATASGFPSAAEQSAIDRLPGGFQCQRAIGEGAVASADGTVDCKANQSPPIDILSSSFSDRTKSDAHVDALVAAAGAEYIAGSDCAETATGLWTGGDFTGRIVCFEGTDGPSLAWTVGAEPIVNVASITGTTDETSAADLVEWWQTNAVPGPIRILQPFPTPREASALQLVPEELAATCSRFIGKPTDGSLGSLECRPLADSSADAAVVDVVYLDVFEEDYDIDAFFNAFELPRADKGGCRVGVPGNNSYSVGDESVGRVACYVRDGRTWMHWYDSRTQLVGQANFTDADVVEPYEWWTTNAVVGASEDRTLDRAERRALQSVPASIADSCVAETVNAENDRWASKLRCKPDAEGLLSVTYFAFQTQRKVTNEFNSRRGEIESGTGTCAAGGVPAERPWEDGDRTGRQICQIRQGVAEIYAADFDNKISVLVAGENDNIDLLANWIAENR